MTLDLDALEAVARAAAEPAPETFSAAAFGAWVMAGREYQKATQPEVTLALITRIREAETRLREAEAVIEEVDDLVTRHHLDTTVGQAVFNITGSYYKPTNQEGGNDGT